jgi:hypothetical protein
LRRLGYLVTMRIEKHLTRGASHFLKEPYDRLISRGLSINANQRKTSSCLPFCQEAYSLLFFSISLLVTTFVLFNKWYFKQLIGYLKLYILLGNVSGGNHTTRGNYGNYDMTKKERSWQFSKTRPLPPLSCESCN